ncbi:cytidylyltransferase domain-containing protein [Paraclostridium sordellii]|uniref:acylneuraminate cytidylyltransferase family protein n=1 Tax=Paraclostridium sordellii TaxID=1505 RepID=UPI0005DF1918|nr:acylneuraminate cytidylyltransferase family protein [Paeniclostridium sordellii]CEN21730.1 acylneuraminate cytidylyltransferase [[Clostridium] sordellii] [Paeniclostridium sordellii]CEP88146.1 acylneuraminate cytidylyltransferase [[Clostridium] sordellii] [Paeniclostridium sordellii]CEP97158.1 acylneuraminate cytidylyltransferase [[Clostridium] sordellii] [Paeniclostridium sordellii]CEQ00847.1 acylneuraminate cytidylyltransferase [[Clostridium] sordellii] [Paeniclostridium sordellii]
MKKSKVLAIIPARAGSKGIKDKNIIDLNGKPLIAHSIEAGLKSKYINKVVVSTDGEKIAKIAKDYGAEVPFLRPKHLATDTAKTIDCVIHCIEELKKNGEEYDYVVLLQPTQPLRQPWHIDEAFELIIKRNEDSLVSISKVKDHPVLMRTIDKNGYAINLLEGSSTKRRQEFPDFYKVNGAIYINKINENLNYDTSFNDNKLVYMMDEQYGIDIDDMLDMEIAKLLIKNL